MKSLTINIDGIAYTVNYEFIPAESGDYETPGTQPTIRLFSVLDTNNFNVTDTLTKIQWHAIEEELYTYEGL